MNNESLKQEIAFQIQKTNQLNNSRWIKDYMARLKSNNLSSVESILKKVSRDYKNYSTASVIVSTLTFAILIMNVIWKLDILIINQVSAIALISFALIFQSFKLYKLKISLEHRIFLLRLIEKIDK